MNDRQNQVMTSTATGVVTVVPIRRRPRIAGVGDLLRLRGCADLKLRPHGMITRGSCSLTVTVTFAGEVRI
jgi:hypothetical protein